ncbi:MAG: hypothetical protein KZQ70_13040, partial [gamma proteobacterium symbiont of Lucinoma myriamae]|nr:hypothetical protein [gamma proteobacterium symbiont of Lucinoma myriamae]
PAHCNIEGNELADIAAKSGASIGKKIDVKISKSEAYAIIKSKVRQEWASNWENYHGFRWELDNSLLPKIVQYSDERQMDRVYTRLRLEINGLRFNNKFYNEADPLCPHLNCGELEDTKHFLLDCRKHENQRKEMLIKIKDILSTNEEINVKTLLNPCPAHAKEIRTAVFKYIKETGYNTII